MKTDEVLNFSAKFLKSRPVVRIRVPTGIDYPRVNGNVAHGGAREPRALLQRVQKHLLLLSLLLQQVHRGQVGLLAFGEHLPQRDAVGPDVGAHGELAVLQALQRVPFDGQFPARLQDVVVVGAGAAGQAEVGDFHVIFVHYEDVSGGQVAMDDLLVSQVLHSLKYKIVIKIEISTALYNNLIRYESTKGLF